MTTAQLYQTTLIQRESGWAVQVIVLPDRSLLAAWDRMLESIDFLGLRAVVPLSNRKEIRAALRAVLIGDNVDEVYWEWQRSLEPKQRGGLRGSSGAEAVVNALFSQPIIPFERSPLSAESLGTILGRGTAVGIGMLAAIAAFGSSPLVFLAVPGGVVLVGAAKGIARALEEGLYRRLLPAIGGQDGEAIMRPALHVGQTDETPLAISAPSRISVTRTMGSAEIEEIGQLLSELAGYPDRWVRYLAEGLRSELEGSGYRQLSRNRQAQLSRWCHPARRGPREQWVQPRACRISELLFGRVIDRRPGP